MGDVGSRIRAFFSYVAKIVNAKKTRKSTSLAVDRDVPAGAVVAGITQERIERAYRSAGKQVNRGHRTITVVISPFPSLTCGQNA